MATLKSTPGYQSAEAANAAYAVSFSSPAVACKLVTRQYSPHSTLAPPPEHHEQSGHLAVLAQLGTLPLVRPQPAS